MQQETFLRANALFQQDRLLFVDMAECVRHGKAVMLYESENAVLLYEKSSVIYMLAANDLEGACTALTALKTQKLTGDRCFIVAHGEVARRAVLNAFPVTKEQKCYQVAYFGNTVPLNGALTFSAPTREEVETVKEIYHLEPPENIERLYAQGKLFSARLALGEERGAFVGFIGIHPEGSMGMLHVFERFRRRGYAEEIEKFLINLYIERGEIPYGHVIYGNQPSLALQEKLGLETATQFVYWLRIQTDKE